MPHTLNKVLLIGRLKNRQWEDGQGDQLLAVEIVASEVVPLDNGIPAAGFPPPEAAYLEDGA